MAGAMGISRIAMCDDTGGQWVATFHLLRCAKEVEAFIEENELNERAGEALRGLKTYGSWWVMDEFITSNCGRVPNWFGSW